MNAEYLQFWGLNPDVTFLNHGSFGACPLPVRAVRRSVSDQLERQPVRFYVRDLAPKMQEARRVLAGFVGAPSEDIVWVENATTGVNTVLRSLSFRPGDEILLANQEYNATRNAAIFVAKRAGAVVSDVDIPYPINDPNEVVDAFAHAMSERTKLVIIDHVVSQTGLVMPLKGVIKAAKSRGIDVLVDGAHAPGMLSLDICDLAPTYYTGNCHKWLCAPKSVAFLYVSPERRDQIRPLVISHGANAALHEGYDRFRAEFDWTGTRDVSAALCVPEAIRFMGGVLEDGWDELRARNHALVLAGRDLLCDALGAIPGCPESMVGSLATVALPDGGDPNLHIDPLQTALLAQHGIEVPVIPWPQSPKRLLRISAQIYNSVSDYEKLAHVLPDMLATR